MEHGPFIDGLPIKHGDFPMAILNNQMVYIYIYPYISIIYIYTLYTVYKYIIHSIIL